MPKCIVMCGLPCSGKSHYAKQLSEEENAIVLSSDEFREKFFGNVDDQSHNKELFEKLHKTAKELLQEGHDVIVDSTNINYKQRMNFLQSLNKIECEKICYLMATPYETCLERNAQRERKVPEEVIKRMYESFWVPFGHEGWDKIKIIYSEGAKDYKGSIINWINSVKDFNQDNYHHKLSLGEHCLQAVTYIFEHVSVSCITFYELIYAAALHDEGKCFTKDFHNGKGEPSEVAHYFNHNFVSAYNSLFYNTPCGNHLYIAQLIQWHMAPYLSWEQSEKAKKRDRKILGGILFNDILFIHAADVAAH